MVLELNNGQETLLHDRQKHTSYTHNTVKTLFMGVS